jgi:hypothetical protein
VETIVKAVGAVLAGSFVSSIFSVVTAITNMGKALTLALGPWGVVASVAVAAIGLIWQNWDKIVAWFEKTCPGLTNILKAIPEAFSKAWDTACGAVTKVVDSIKERIANMVPESMKKFFGIKPESIGAAASSGTNQSAAPQVALPLQTAQPDIVGQKPQEMTGRIVVEVRADNNSTASVEDLQATGGELTAETNSYGYMSD